MIPLRIQNLPRKMVDSFATVKPKTFAEFCSIAKTAENNMKRNHYSNFNRNDYSDANSEIMNKFS